MSETSKCRAKVILGDICSPTWLKECPYREKGRCCKVCQIKSFCQRRCSRTENWDTYGACEFYTTEFNAVLERLKGREDHGT